MSNKVENIVLSVVAVLAVAVVVVLYICGARRQSGMECGGVRVNVTDSKVNKFVSEGDVKKIVSTNYGDITGVFADSIDLVSMERLLEKKSVIRDCEAYFTRDGFLNIDITQRTPVVRFQNAPMPKDTYSLFSGVIPLWFRWLTVIFRLTSNAGSRDRLRIQDSGNG